MELLDETADKVFSRWFVSALPVSIVEKPIKSLLLGDLDDGVLLFELVKVLTKEEPVINRKPRHKMQMLDNLFQIIRFLKGRVTTLAITPDDFICRRKKQVLRFFWDIIQYYHLQKTSELVNPTESIILFLNEKGCNISSITEGFKDGTKLIKLINALKPGSISDDKITGQPLADITTAMTIARDTMNIPWVIDPEDFIYESPALFGHLIYLYYYRRYVDRPSKNEVDYVEIVMELSLPNQISKDKTSNSDDHKGPTKKGSDHGLNSEQGTTKLAISVQGEDDESENKDIHGSSDDGQSSTNKQKKRVQKKTMRKSAPAKGLPVPILENLKGLETIKEKKNFTKFTIQGEEGLIRSILFIPHSKIHDILNTICNTRGWKQKNFILTKLDDTPIAYDETTTLDDLGLEEVRFIPKSSKKAPRKKSEFKLEKTITDNAVTTETENSEKPLTARSTVQDSRARQAQRATTLRECTTEKVSSNTLTSESADSNKKKIDKSVSHDDLPDKSNINLDNHNILTVSSDGKKESKKSKHLTPTGSGGHSQDKSVEVPKEKRNISMDDKKKPSEKKLLVTQHTHGSDKRSKSRELSISENSPSKSPRAHETKSKTLKIKRKSTSDTLPQDSTYESESFIEALRINMNEKKLDKEISSKFLRKLSEDKEFCTTITTIKKEPSLRKLVEREIALLKLNDPNLTDDQLSEKIISSIHESVCKSDLSNIKGGNESIRFSNSDIPPPKPETPPPKPETPAPPKPEIHHPIKIDTQISSLHLNTKQDSEPSLSPRGGNSATTSTTPVPTKKLDVLEPDGYVYCPNNNSHLLIKGGTIEKLIQHMTCEHSEENTYVDTFLLTYRSHMGGSDLLEHLFLSYNIDSKFSFENEQQKKDYENQQHLTRVRLTNVLRNWITRHFHDFESDKELIIKLKQEIEKTFAINEPELKKIIFRAIEKRESEMKKERKTMFSVPAPRPIIPKSSEFQDFNPTEVARQLSLYEQHLFQRIHPKEFLNSSWIKHKENASSIVKLTQTFNDISRWVITEIVTKSSEKERIATVKTFLAIMLECLKLNNFNTLFEISSAFDASAVHRLKTLWAKVEKSKNYKLYEEKIKPLLSPHLNRTTYRAALKASDPPILPYLGVFLTDLTFVEDGNQNFLAIEGGRSDIVNFEKMRKTAVLIQQVIIYQQQPYNITKVDEIYNYFERGLKYLDEEKCYELSKEIEPRK